MNRVFHLGGLCWFLLALLMLGAGVSPLAPLAAGILALGALLTPMIRRKQPPPWVYAVAKAALLCPLSILLYNALFYPPAEDLIDKRLQIRGIVLSFQRDNGMSTVLLRADAETEKALAGAKIRIYGRELDVRPGDVIEYEGLFTRKPQRRLFMDMEGVKLESFAEGEDCYAVVGKNLTDPEAFFGALRRKASERLRSQLVENEQDGGTLAAMLFGETRLLPAAQRDAYARSGISHLLAVSGLHLSLVCGLAGAALEILSLPRRLQSLIKMACVLLFMGLAGFSPSVMRAGVMLLICESAALFGRDYDTLNSLGFALILLLLQNPYSALRTGLQLSYLATMGIASFAEPMENRLCQIFFRTNLYDWMPRHKLGHLLLGTGCVSICANLLTLPVVLWTYGEFSLVSLPMNLLVSPLCTVAIGGGMLSVLLSAFWMEGAQVAAFGAGLAARAINLLAKAVGGWRYSAVSAKSDWTFIWMGVILLAGVLLWYLKAPRKVLLWGGELAAVTLLAGAFSHAVFYSNTAALLSPEGGESLAVSYGSQAVVIGAPATESEARELIRFFKDRGTRQLDLMVLRKETDRLGRGAQVLTAAFLPRETVTTESGGFFATAFGWVEISSGPAGEVLLRMDGFTAVKSYDMSPHQAHLLFNKRGEAVAAQGLTLWQNGRYYNGAVLMIKRRSVPTG